MPYIKPLVDPPFAAVGRMLRGYEVTPVSLAEKTGWSYGKAAARLSSPQTLTLAELDLISAASMSTRTKPLRQYRRG